MRMPSLKRHAPRLATLVWSSCILVGAVGLIVTAPTTHARMVSAFELALAGVLIIYATWRMRRRIDRTMTHLVETLSELETDPHTTVTAHRAMDGIRNIWGGQADRWLNKSNLN